MTGRTWKLPWLAPVVAGAVASSTLLLGLASPDVQAQTFRAGVNLIVLEVQLRDKSGRAIETLDAKGFEVTLDGKQRRVVSADLVRVEGPTRTAGEGPVVNGGAGSMSMAGRSFVIAIDAGSFRTLDSHVAVLAAQRFISGLRPNDIVTVVTVPHGPVLRATTNHAAAKRTVGAVVGTKPELKGEFEFTPAEVIDITSALSTQSRDQLMKDVIASRSAPETAGSENDAAGADDIAKHCSEGTGPPELCFDKVVSEVEQAAVVLEQNALQAISGLDSLLQVLQGSPERKTVLLLSAGIPMNDRGGSGRPSLGNALKRIGEQAAYANATVHAVVFERSHDQSTAAESRRSREASLRTRGILTRALSEFSEPSGGLLLLSETGGGEVQIDRVLAESSAYYLLGVEPDARDRDGRPHKVQVKVRDKSATVRSRQLVVVPRPK